MAPLPIAISPADWATESEPIAKALAPDALALTPIAWALVPSAIASLPTAILESSPEPLASAFVPRTTAPPTWAFDPNPQTTIPSWDALDVEFVPALFILALGTA